MQFSNLLVPCVLVAVVTALPFSEIAVRTNNYTSIDSSATPTAQSLLRYIQNTQGSGKTISGQHDAASLAWVVQNIGKTPAIQGNDLMDYSPSRVARGTKGTSIDEALAFDTKGGINAFEWHWNAPTDLIDSAAQPWYKGFYTSATTFSLSSALAEGPSGPNYQLLLRDIDAIAVQLKRLSDANVPILFRPLHEPDGAWFWWGASGSAAFKQLWDVLYTRITQTHDLHNLVWVCNTGKSDWYPGNDKCDIATVDIYASAGDHNPQVAQYDASNTLTGGSKLLALAEVGVIPSPDQMDAQGKGPWAFWAVWAGEYIENGSWNTLDAIKQYYYYDKVVTLDTLGSWKST